MTHAHSFRLLLLLILTGFVIGCGEKDPKIETADSTQVETELDSTATSTSDSVETNDEETLTIDPTREVASGRLFQDRANRVVGGTIPVPLIASIRVDGTSMEVTLQNVDDVPAYADYFEIADEANKIIAITSVRWFRDLPALQHLLIEMPTPGGPRIYELDRTEVASYYNLSIRNLAKDPSEKNWRDEFLAQWDREEKRKAFVEAHLK